MVRIAFTLEYCGKNFNGSQYQDNVRTVQAELEKALKIFWKQPISVILAGRTDSGVHALGQVAHFDLRNAPPREIDLWRFIWSLNGILSEDLCISSAMLVPEKFHARHSAIERHYVYRILNRPQRSALYKDTHYFVSYKLDQNLMKEAAAFLKGRHDFAAFCSSNTEQTSSICTVSKAELLNLGEGRLEFWIAADHFVYNMVRIIVGTLVEIGLGKRPPESIAKALESGRRQLAGPTAPAKGLCLASVKYKEAFNPLFAEVVSATSN